MRCPSTRIYTSLVRLSFDAYNFTEFDAEVCATRDHGRIEIESVRIGGCEIFPALPPEMVRKLEEEIAQEYEPEYVHAV